MVYWLLAAIDSKEGACVRTSCGSGSRMRQIESTFATEGLRADSKGHKDGDAAFGVERMWRLVRK
jgi:hypothetical protein